MMGTVSHRVLHGSYSPGGPALCCTGTPALEPRGIKVLTCTALNELCRSPRHLQL